MNTSEYKTWAPSCYFTVTDDMNWGCHTSGFNCNPVVELKTLLDKYYCGDESRMKANKELQ